MQGDSLGRPAKMKKTSPSMTSQTKRRIAGFVLLVSAVAMVVCLYKMIPYGLSGEAGRARQYLMYAMVAFVVALVSGITYYFYRSSAKENV